MPYPLGVKKKEIWLKHGESLPLKVNFFGLGQSLQFQIFGDFILLPFFNYGIFSWVNKRHPYEMDGKKRLHKRALDEEETNDKKNA
jgi:hypothetical protein